MCYVMINAVIIVYVLFLHEKSDILKKFKQNTNVAIYWYVLELVYKLEYSILICYLDRYFSKPIRAIVVVLLQSHWFLLYIS